MTPWIELIVELTLTSEVSLHTNLVLQSEDRGLQEIQSSEGVQPQLIGDQNDNNYRKILPIPHMKEKQLAKMGLTSMAGRQIVQTGYQDID